MKSASNFWIFVLLTLTLFNCASRKPDPSDAFPMQKAYVLLRTEGLDTEINKLSSILNSNFVTQKIASDINHYPIGRTWKTNEIFSTAYNNNYDYIIIIDQVAKFTIDGKTNVGGKYQIRSYHVKSSNPDWVDLGQKTCNISVRQSIDKFSQQIISQIVPNYISPKVSYNKESLNYEDQQTQISEIDYNQLKSSKEIDVEIAELRKQLEKEKKRTIETIAEKERLEKEYEQALNFQKKKNQTVLEGLESFKKEKELAEVKQKEEKRLAEQKVLKDKAIADAILEEKKRLKELEQKEEKERLAQAKILEEKRLEKELIAETQRLEDIRLKEQEKELAEVKRKEEKRLAEQKVLKDKAIADAILEEKKRLKELEQKEEKERLAQAKILEEKRLEKELIAETQLLEEQEKKGEEERFQEEQLVEAERLKKIRKKELEKKAEEKRLAQVNQNENKSKTSSKNKFKKTSNKKSKSVNKTIDKSNALIIIRGSEEDFESFHKLKDNLEFELLFANIKATTQIFNLKEVVNKKDVLSFNQPNYKYLIFIEQFDTTEDGSSNFSISVYPSKSNSTWQDLGQKPFNLNDRTSLKEFSKTVLKSL